MHREALKVFLESLKPFSSEKGFKPPEALRAKRGTGAKRRLTAKPCNCPFSLRLCWLQATQTCKLG